MEIGLTQGKTTVVDEADAAIVQGHSWYAALQHGRWYALTNVIDPVTDKPGKLAMHRLIVSAPSRLYVDHRDGDGLNNRRSDLRLATNAQNQQNTNPKGGSSPFKGVSWIRSRERWRVAFHWEGRFYFVGTFRDELTAAHAYDAAVLPLAGEFARLNFPKVVRFRG